MPAAFCDTRLVPTRTYGQACPLARALDVVGERWTLLVLRELAPGARRFGELLDELPGMSTNLLSARLQRLEREGLVERAPDRRWRLTESGEGLRPAVAAFAVWGMQTFGTGAADDGVHVPRPEVRRMLERALEAAGGQ